jgi:2,4-dienoyl-CoA reductase-like NADH-dependent reductase (Old Yellow Enzyme family)
MFLQSLTEPKDVVFRELYLLDPARKLRAAVTMPLAYLGGVESLANVEQALGEGFDAVALGRALIFAPDLVEQFRTGAAVRSGCTRCNRCVTMMYTPGGTSCVLHAPNDAALNAEPARGAEA